MMPFAPGTAPVDPADWGGGPGVEGGPGGSVILDADANAPSLEAAEERFATAPLGSGISSQYSERFRNPSRTPRLLVHFLILLFISPTFSLF
jgi:hypothetical protein